MRPIGDRQPIPVKAHTAPLQAAAAKLAAQAVPERKLARLAADAIGAAVKAQGFKTVPPLDVEAVNLPGDFANNGTQSGTSGTKGTARPGTRRVDAPAAREGQDLANNTTQAGSTGGPRQPRPNGPRRADAGMSIQEIGEA
jgi:hypothetical protein